MGVRVKRPGEQMLGDEKELLVSEDPAGEMLPYERLLGDAMRGDAHLFARQDEVEAQWRVVDPVLGDDYAALSIRPGDVGPRRSGSTGARRRRSLA